MPEYLKVFALLLFSLATFLPAKNVYAFQIDKADRAKLRKSMTEAIGPDFEIVKDIIDRRPAARGGETYWLVHAKPKRSGQFALRYTYKYTHNSSHPEEGENALMIQVGPKGCYRHNSNNLGLGNVCLGDTVIIPIRLDRVTGHRFSLKATYSDSPRIGAKPEYYLPDFTHHEKLVNPLEKHLKYLGTNRAVIPHRNYGAQTVTYTAYFEAQKPGRFNFAVSRSSGDENPDNKIKVDPLDALPVVIVEPGTPITALTYYEYTINYSDNKRFSGHAANNFITKLLIIQPGDIFAIEYSSFVERWNFDGTREFREKPEDQKDRRLVVLKLPFMINKDWSYNAWLAGYLPKAD